MNELTFLLDIDDCLCDLATYWIQKYNKDHDDNLTKENITNWNIGSFTKIGDGMYDYLRDLNLYEQVNVMPDALEAINYIRQIPHSQIVYATHSYWHPGQKYNWLIKHGFFQEQDQYFEGLGKNMAKWMINADIMIDDNPTHIKEFRGELAILYAAPWNAELRKTHSPTISNWQQFIDKVKEII